MTQAGRLRLPLILVAAGVALLAGFAVKDRCTTHVWDGFQYRSSCYNDIFSLYFFRGLGPHDHDGDARNEHAGHFPYVEGDGELATTNDGDLEYPVVTGYLIGAAGRLATSGQEFFRLNALALAVAGLAAVALVFSIARDFRRALLFALAPSLVLYAFHNWDLLAVALFAGGLAAFHRHRDGLSGAMLGLGAAAKVFPAFVLPALALARWRQIGRVPVAMVVAAPAAFVAVNLPILLVNARGWILPWKFNAERFPNFETSWYMAYRHLQDSFGNFWVSAYPRFTSVASAALFLAALTALLVSEARRPTVRPYALSFGILLAFLLTTKVYSPQFALWLLPLFVLVRVPWYGFGAFAATDAAVWAAVSAFFLSYPPLNAGDQEFRLTLLEGAVFVRYAILAWLLWWTRRHGEETVEKRPAPERLARTGEGAPVEFRA